MSKDFFPKHARQHRKTPYFAQIFSDILPHFPTFSLSFFSFFHRSVTLVTAKKQHCGWNARTYACLRVDARNAPRKFSLHFFLIFSSSSFFSASFLIPPHSPSLPSSSLLGHSILVSLYFAICVSQICCFAKKKMHFSTIFSRFGAISSHIQIGGCVVNPHLFRN